MTHNARTRLGGPPRRGLLIWAVLVAAVVAAGLLGRLASRPAPHASAPPIAVASPLGPTSTPAPSLPTENPPPGIVVTTPLPGTVERGQSVPIAGTVIGSAPAVEISIAVGAQIVGATDLLVAAAGTFGGSVPLEQPMAGTPATLTVRTVDRPDVVSFPIVLDASVPVFVRLPNGADLRSGPSSRLYPILGTTEAPIDRVTATLQDAAGDVLASGSSPISAYPLGGAFAIALALPSSFRGSGLSLRLSWTEPASGRSGRVAVPLTEGAAVWHLPAASPAIPPAGTRRYSDGTFSFDYPAAWRVRRVAPAVSASPTSAPTASPAGGADRTLVLLGNQVMSPTCTPRPVGTRNQPCDWGLAGPLALGAIVATWDVVPLAPAGASLAFPGAQFDVGHRGRLDYELPGACALLEGGEMIVVNTVGPLGPPQGGRTPMGRYRMTACLAGSGPDLERNETLVFEMLASAAWR